MSSDNSAAGPAPTGKKPQSRVKKLVVRGGIAIFAIAVLVEAISQRYFNATLTSVAERLETDESAQKETPAEELQGLIQGWPLKNMTAVRDGKVVALRWPSVFKRYHLQWSVDSNGMVQEFATEPRFAERPVIRPAVEVPKLEPTVPQGWMVVSVRQINEPVLVRELVRQSLFLCARESFGLTPADEILREVARGDLTDSGAVEDGQPIQPSRQWPFLVTAMKKLGKAADKESVVTVQVLRLSPYNQEYIFNREIPGTVEQRIASIATLAEQWSHNEFVGAIEKAGYIKNAAPPEQMLEPAVVTDETAKLLKSLNPISQVVALRSLAEQLDERTASVEAMTAMARSYALLGSLVELNWSSMHKVMKARGLLLAERSVRMWPDSALAWQSRAYVRALVGLHDLAIADLEKAGALDGAARPDWVPAITAFCRWEDAQLEKLASQGNLHGLYFRLLASEIAGDSFQQVAAAKSLWEADPDCWRAMAFLASSHGIGVGHFVNSAGLDSIHESMARLLNQAGDLPQNVKKLASEESGEQTIVGQVLGMLAADRVSNRSKKIVRTLRDITEGDSGSTLSVSWQTTAAIIEDSLFQLAIETLGFERNSLGTDPEELLTRMKSLLEDHPLASAIEGFHVDDEIARPALATLSQVLSAVNLSDGAMSLYNGLAYRSNGLLTVHRRVEGQSDDILPDRARRWSDLSGEFAGREVPSLLVLASRCPVSAVMSIRADWEASRDRAPEWEVKHPTHVGLFRELASRYEKDRRPKDSERCFLKVVELTEDPSELIRLSDFYYRHDEWDKQKRTLERALKMPGISLEHASASSRLAYTYMERGEWSNALPHAQNAASSYAGWGLQCAAHCYEGLEDWEAAEEFQRACAERYRNEGASWYFQCHRVGHGKLDEARKLARETLEGGNDIPFLDLARRRAVFAKLEGKDHEAFRMADDLLRQNPRPYSRFLVAVWAHDLGMTRERDEQLIQLSVDDSFPCESLVARLTLQALVGHSGVPSDEALMFGLFTNMQTGQPTNNAFFIAECLRMLGETERAKKWYVFCNSSPVTVKLTTALAGARLTAMGVSPSGRRPRELADVKPAVVRLLQTPDDGKLRKSSEWVEKYREAAEVEPTLASIHFLLGTEAAKISQFDEAERALSKAIELVPLLSEPLVTRGEIIAAAGEPLRAILDYEKALELVPRDIAANRQLVLIFALHPDDQVRDLELAKRHAQAVFDHPLAAEVEKRSLRAILEASNGQFEVAEKLLRNAFKETPASRQRLVSEMEGHYGRKRLYRLTPSSVPLLSSIPADGTWARYRVLLKEKEEQFEGTLEVRSVGQFEKEDEKLRAVELEIRADNDVIPNIAFRVIVPELQFGPWKKPAKHIGKVWSRVNGEIIERSAGDPVRAQLQEWLAGPIRSIGQSSGESSVDGPNGPISVPYFLGGSTIDIDGSKADASWTVYKHEDSPFSVVKAFVELRDRRPMKIELTLEDFGDGAKASMPELVP